MYADTDRAGRISIFEMTSFEKDTLLEALERFSIILQDTVTLIEGNEFIHQQQEATDKMIHSLKHL